jgi:hypothetical protein
MLGRTPPFTADELYQMLQTNSQERYNKNYTKVTLHWDEYEPHTWMSLINQVTKEFGKSGKRWQWQMNPDKSVGNAWAVDFYFLDPHEATLFQLKY